MEVTYPKPQCELSPNGAHHFIKVSGFWRCAHCKAAMWLPTDFVGAQEFSSNVRKLGVEPAYRKLLRYRPQIRRMLVLIEEARQADKELEITQEDEAAVVREGRNLRKGLTEPILT